MAFLFGEYRKETKSKWGHSGFPEQIPETCILLSSKPDDIVLDMFVGSGTTAVVAIKHKRKYIGIDLDKSACDIAIQRIKNAQAQLKLF